MIQMFQEGSVDGEFVPPTSITYEDFVAFVQTFWTWFAPLELGLQIVVTIGIFFLCWGIAKLVYTITKLSLWATYKVMIYIFIGMIALIYMIVSAIKEIADKRTGKSPVDDTANRLYAMMEAEKDIWPFPFFQDKDKKAAAAKA